LVDDLIGFLGRAPDVVVERIAPNEIEASAVSSLHHERLREYLESYLNAWQTRHPGVASSSSRNYAPGRSSWRSSRR
jgi:hypothetical protein